MTATEVHSSDATNDATVGKGDMKLEVVVIPVSDVDRAKEFYGGLGWRLDGDFSAGSGRVVQFTPPGSQCSIHFGTNVTSAAPGSAQSVFLIVANIQAAREELMARGRRGQRRVPLRGLQPRRPQRAGDRPRAGRAQ